MHQVYVVSHPVLDPFEPDVSNERPVLILDPISCYSGAGVLCMVKWFRVARPSRNGGVVRRGGVEQKVPRSRGGC